MRHVEAAPMFQAQTARLEISGKNERAKAEGVQGQKNRVGVKTDVTAKRL